MKKLQPKSVQVLIVFLLAVAFPFFVCAENGDRASLSPGAPMKVEIMSDMIKSGEMIPAIYTADGEDLSPGLAWRNLPAGVKELAMVMDDPDAPSSTPWVHWVIYNIPASVTALPQGLPKSATVPVLEKVTQGKNSWGTIGYRGPAPPRGHGVHHYHFKLLALDVSLGLKAGLDKEALLKAVSGHVLEQGELVATYQR